MRNQFHTWVDANLAPSPYHTNTAPETPSHLCSLCREYNNKFSILTDTRLVHLENGDLVITGNINRWLETCCCYGMYGFFNSLGLRWNKGILNGDKVIFITRAEESETGIAICHPISYCIGRSNIPHPIATLTTTGDIHKLRECLSSENVIEALNNSPYVKGDQWAINDNTITGNVGGSLVMINL